MSFTSEIYDILRSVGCTKVETSKAILGIAAIGLLIGEERLENIIHDQYAMENRLHFENDVILSGIQWEFALNGAEIKRLALELISRNIKERTLIQITEIILKENLYGIVMWTNLFEADPLITAPIADVESINELVISILREHGGKKLLNVNCATGRFVTDAFHNSLAEKIIGVSSSYYDIAQIRAYFLSKDVSIYKDDSIFVSCEEKVDMAYVTFPLISTYDKLEAIRMTDKWDFPFEIKKQYTANLLNVVNILQSVTEDGIVVALVSEGSMVNDVDSDIRKYLIDKNYIKAIISLPIGILPFARIPTSLIVLEKSKKDDFITMIDATEICRPLRRYMTFEEEHIDKIMEMYMSDDESEKCMKIKKKEIVTNNYSLGINRYKKVKEELINPCKLEDVTKSIFRGYQIAASELDKISTNDMENTEYRIINLSDINADGLMQKELRPVSIEDDRKFSKYIVEDGDIIITAKNTTFKSAIYRGANNCKAILTGNLIAIRVNKKKVDPFYLKAFLDSGIGNAMIKRIQTGTSIISISPNSLKEATISLPSIEIQEEIANQYKVTLNKMEEYLEKYNTQAQHIKNIYNLVTENRL